MKAKDMIPADEFCVHHEIEITFVQTLRRQGMLETVVMGDQLFIPVSELGHLEKIIHLHFELGINIEGIETITHLLDRITAMQEHITMLNNRLKGLEDSG
jgi:hypothetical protein